MTLIAGLMDQWLIEGKFSHEEVLSLSFDMLSAGIDTVRVKVCQPITQKV